MSTNTADMERRMRGSLRVLHSDFSSLRTGRASPALLEKIRVSVYGTPTPLAQLATISTPEPRMLNVSVWDKSNAPAIDKAIRESRTGLNPILEGANLRIPIPPLDEERRTELAKQAGRFAETARIAIRNIRREGMDALKTMEKNGEISRDRQKKEEGRIQKLTDDYVAKIDQSLKAKESEIMQV